MRLLARKVLFLCSFSCAHGGPPTKPPTDVAGLSIPRLEGWQTLTRATEPPGVMLQLRRDYSPLELAATIELRVRTLNASEARIPGEELLDAVALELRQTYETGEIVDSRSTQVAAQPARRVLVRFEDRFGDDRVVPRAGLFYAWVKDAKVWLVQCFGPADGAAHQDCESLVGNLSYPL